MKNVQLLFQVIFTQIQYSDEAALPPDVLRQALAVTFKVSILNLEITPYGFCLFCLVVKLIFAKHCPFPCDIICESSI